MKNQFVLPVALAACIVSAPAAAQFQKPEHAVKYRQSAMFLMANHFYTRIGGMVNGRAPYDAKVAADSAEVVATLSKLPWGAFPAGSDKGDTDAKPGVWSEPERFKDLADKMQVETAKLATVARANDLEALKVQYRATSNSCKACHDRYTSQ
jgi:cytochrome c556